MDEVRKTAQEVRWLKRTLSGRPVAEVTVQIRLTKPGIAVGSIVECCDAEVMPVTLPYPFTALEFERAVAWVEDEAQRIWDETHGCDSCRRHLGVEEDSLSPVWEECPDCGGHGTVI
jgi:hypothetical protein